jgi:hypothetical protein
MDIRQHGDRISLLSFFRNKENRLKSKDEVASAPD